VAVALATVAATALTYRLAAHLKAARVLANLQSPADVAYNKLYAAWVELGPSFMPWWQAQGLDTRTSVMRTARDAVRAELGEAAAAMDTLCPELRWGEGTFLFAPVASVFSFPFCTTTERTPTLTNP